MCVLALTTLSAILLLTQSYFYITFALLLRVAAFVPSVPIPTYSFIYNKPAPIVTYMHADCSILILQHTRVWITIAPTLDNIVCSWEGYHFSPWSHFLRLTPVLINPRTLSPYRVGHHRSPQQQRVVLNRALWWISGGAPVLLLPLPLKSLLFYRYTSTPLHKTSICITNCATHPVRTVAYGVSIHSHWEYQYQNIFLLVMFNKILKKLTHFNRREKT